MAIAAGADIVPITQRVIVETTKGEAVVIAATFDGNNMHYLLVPLSRNDAVARPEWVAQNEVNAVYSP